jgi:uncharacterized protein (TIGR03083 family)
MPPGAPPETGARATGDPVVEVLAEVWASFADACRDLAAEDWELETDCPGWTVRDQLSHIIGYERVLGGEAMLAAVEERPDHVRNDVGAVNEAMVELRRTRPGPEVLAEFEAVTAERLESLRRRPVAEFDVVGWSPVGEAPYRELLGTRVFDSWVHEQDVRRAVGRAGGRGGGGEAETLGRVERAMPYVVGKKVAPAEGSVVAFVVTGPLPRAFAVAIRDGRGRAEPVGDAPAVHFTMMADDFWRLGCGRTTPGEVRRTGAVTIEGDQELAGRVLDAMNFMF